MQTAKILGIVLASAALSAPVFAKNVTFDVIKVTKKLSVSAATSQIKAADCPTGSARRPYLKAADCPSGTWRRPYLKTAA